MYGLKDVLCASVVKVGMETNENSSKLKNILTQRNS
jgi:hypothetical protein